MHGIPPAPPLASFLQQTINDLRRDNTNLTQENQFLKETINDLQINISRLTEENDQLKRHYDELKTNFKILWLKLEIYEKEEQERKSTLIKNI